MKDARDGGGGGEDVHARATDLVMYSGLVFRLGATGNPAADR